MVAEDGAGALDAVHEHDDVPHGRHLGRLGVGAGGGGTKLRARTERSGRF